MNKKVYVIGPYSGYSYSIIDKTLVDNIEDADVVVLTGGSDVDPSTYGKKAHPMTYGNKNRDIFEISEYRKVRKDQVVVGVCRGAQLLCVLNGGILVQHVSNHAGGDHLMIDRAGHVFPITSLHHQMMYPFDIDPRKYNLLFVSYPSKSMMHLGDGIDEEMIRKHGEPELIVFQDENEPIGLAIQGHPEMMSHDSKTVKMFNELIDELVEEAKKRTNV